ncbi:MAG: hypothetical protein AAFQ98_23380 [Bacteroidota bacterium]
MIRFAFFLLCMMGSYFTIAQSEPEYSQEYLEKSTSFAWLTLGGDLLTLSGGTTQQLVNGTPESVPFGPTIQPRLTIGGFHFWGHADFYVTFPVAAIGLHDLPTAHPGIDYRQGVETGARVYPWKVKPNSLRPFVGISFRSLSFQQNLDPDIYDFEGPNYSKMIAPLQVGLSYTTQKWSFTGSAYFQFQNEIDYYLSPTETGTIGLDPFSFQVGVVRYMDIDRGARTAAGVKGMNDRFRLLEEEGKLSDWYVGIGPSAALQVSRSPFLKSQHPYLYDDYLSGFMADITVGRYFYKPDMNVGLSYRGYSSTTEGFDTEVGIGRRSVMLEAYKFLFNYLGFVPFAGPTVSAEFLRTSVNGNQFSETKPAVGLIFGWDIRVGQTERSLLRTNLRWVPNLHMDVEGEAVMFDHLEFNFIQWVYFPGRAKVFKNR